MESWIFLHLGKQSLTMVGPMVLEQAKLEVQANRLNLGDLVYLPDTGWKRIFSVEKFSELLMPLPNVKELAHFEKKAKSALPSNDDPTVIQQGPDKSKSSLTIKPALKQPQPESASVDPDDRSTWFLQFEGSEFGPFTVPELGKILDSGKLKGNLYAWKKGLKNWVPVANLNQLYKEVGLHKAEAESSVIEKGSNMRAHPRTSLVATISCTINKVAQVIGVCSDISAGGMQVLNSGSLEFNQDEKIELMVNPIGVTGIEPFSVRARVAWVSESPHKVGFQFLEGENNRHLQDYIRRSIGIFK